MRTRHLMRWHCVAKTHDTPVVFELEEMFIEHMKTEHPGKFRDEQLPTIAESSSHPKDPTFDDCPFCTATPPNLEKHVGEHLRDLALQSLPWPEDDEYEPQDESCSANENSSPDESTRGTLRDCRPELSETFLDDYGPDFDTDPLSENNAGVRLGSYGYIPKVEDEHSPLGPAEQQTDEIMAALARHQCPETTSRSPIYAPQLRDHVIPLTKTKLENAKVDSVYQGRLRPFVPRNSLYVIINKVTVQCALEELVHDGRLRTGVAEISRLTQAIAPDLLELSDAGGGATEFRRVFAALILLGKAECIFEFVQYGVNDSEMCGMVFAPNQSDADGSLPLPFRNKESWSRQDIRNFGAVRWELTPVFFSRNWPSTASDLATTPEGIPHFELQSSDVILPFLPAKREQGTKDLSSQYEFYHIHQVQHNLPRYTVRIMADFIGY